MALPKIFKPYKSKNLIRLGHNKDGGYVVNREIIEKSSTLLTFGLCDEFSFEKDFLKNIDSRSDSKFVYAFDHTVNFSFWVQNLIRWTLHFLKYRKNFKRIFTFFDYYSFFKKKNAKHFKVRVRSSKENIPNSIDIDNIIKNNQIAVEKCILKIDIDMDEYRILDDIKKYNFLAIIVEFSHTDVLEKNVINFIEVIKDNYKIIHIHGNNFDYPDKLNNPKFLEITFANQNYIEIYNEQIDYTLPIENLDFPNDTKKNEIKITFGQ